VDNYGLHIPSRVTCGHSRSMNGGASLAYDPGVHAAVPYGLPG